MKDALSPFVLAVMLAVASGADAAVWRATALDPQTVVLQGDYTRDDLAEFAMTDDEQQLDGWKFNLAFEDAAARATSRRPATESKLSAGPYAAEGAEISAFSHWRYPIGAERFPDGRGKTKVARIPEVMQIVYLKLARPLPDGAHVKFRLPTGDRARLYYTPQRTPTPLVKVNQVGYSPSQGRKFAYLGGWLGPKFGAYEPADGLRFELVDEKSGQVVKKGPLTFRVPDRENDGIPFCGERTLEMDFSDVATEGRYFIRVPGVGRSLSFKIGASAIGAAFATHMLGLFHQRCGCDKPTSLTPWSDKPCHMSVLRGVHPPDPWQYESCFTDKDGKPVKTHHFPVIGAMTRDLTEKLSLPGGWHDAADFDRRPVHMEVVNALVSAYLLRPQNFTDSQLLVPERGNGIPDILDEAIWGMRHMFAAQQTDGGVGTWIETRRHPTPDDNVLASGDALVYSLSRATRGSSLQYAAHAALLSRALEAVGTPEARKASARFQTSAVAAWRFSRRPAPGPVTMRSGWERADEVELVYREPEELDPNDEVKAALNLYALTGDRTYLAVFDKVGDAFVETTNKRGWTMAPERHVEFWLGDVDAAGYARLRDFWNARVIEEANRMLAEEEGPESYAYRVPWHPPTDWRVSHMSWGTCHPLRRAKTLCCAHAITGERKYLDAAYLANDFHNGCNPNGATWTAGLGVVYPVKYLSIVSVGDGIAEYVAGITPYRSTYGMDPVVRETTWRGDGTDAHWPVWRRYGNMEEFSVAASEFAVSETIAPAAFTTGYLMTPGAEVPLPRLRPAKDIRVLPGYWTLP